MRTRKGRPRIQVFSRCRHSLRRMLVHRQRRRLQLQPLRARRRKRRRRAFFHLFIVAVVLLAMGGSTFLAYDIGHVRGTLETQDKYRTLEIKYESARFALRSAYRTLYQWYPYKRQSDMDKFGRREREVQKSLRSSDSVFAIGDSLGKGVGLQNKAAKVNSDSGSQAVNNRRHQEK